MNKKVNPVPFQNYFGGKSGAGVYQSIINHIPPHRLFVVPFAGNCGVFKNMQQSEWVIINDLDSDVSEAWYETGITVKGGVDIYNEDARNLLVRVSDDGIYKKWWQHMFIYLDPPYLKSTRRGQIDVYKHEFGEETEHIDLLHCLLLMPLGVKIMISHYPCALYDELLKGWSTYDFQAKTRKGVATERIYMNYSLDDGRLHDYSFIGKTFREREKHKRIMVNFFAKLDRMPALLRNKILQEYNLQHRIK